MTTAVQQFVNSFDTLSDSEKREAVEEILRRAARLEPAKAPRQPGLCQGMLTVVSEDNEHLQDFHGLM